MKLLLDTHLLLWASLDRNLLPANAATLMADPAAKLFFSAASIWEVAIKFNRGRPDFQLHPGRLRLGLLHGGYRLLDITSDHILATVDLPPIHKDPFDRLLLAQAIVENLTLLTADRNLLAYPGPVLAA